MTKFWFDSNFFIAVNETNQIPLLKRLFAQLRTIHQFFITKRIRDEVFFFNDTIRLYFKVITVENSSEFKNFCFSVRHCLKNSKKKMSLRINLWHLLLLSQTVIIISYQMMRVSKELRKSSKNL